jgi:Arc/MetJ-type ribon-helix-helix transcriptional regulator
MSDIEFTLPDMIAKFADAQIRSGRFSTINDYLEALVLADQQTQKFIESLSGKPPAPAFLTEDFGQWPG